MIPPATEDLRRLLDDYRSTGSVYLPDVVQASLRSTTDEALLGELARRGRWVLGDRDPLAEVRAERVRQDERWGVQDHPSALDGMTVATLRSELRLAASSYDMQQYLTALAETGEVYWAAILLEEVAEAVEAVRDPGELRRELVQVAAVAVAWVECLDRRGGAR